MGGTDSATSSGPATAAVILAAGRGTRLGGRSKPLLRVAGRTLAGRALAAAEEAGTVPILVLGHRSAEVIRVLQEEEAALLQRSEVVVVPQNAAVQVPLNAPGVLDNPEEPGDMAVSFRTGIRRSLQLDIQQVAVLLVDQPGIGGAALRQVMAAHRPGTITRGAVQGRPGHPVLFDRLDASQAAALVSGDQGARTFLTLHRERTRLMELSGVGAPAATAPATPDTDADIDTLADLRRWTSAGTD